MLAYASIDTRELQSYDYRNAEVISVSENGHRLSRRYDFAKVRRMVFAGIPERILFMKTRNVLLDPGHMKGFRWDNDLTVWIRGSNHDEIVRDILMVADHYEGHLEIVIRLHTGKRIVLTL